ncbi:MAG TPA: NAD-dependent succinate-semialdehyde dehydrogenase [Opitutaceae bacterium]|jgi:succinate-semialdehyde dehydrogenase/glutarate-semialdehyde dehydrogenase|nr:NAD-dependent succinate-semialdehyde dehydrogenase [Opitutaceae bacterium]
MSNAIPGVMSNAGVQPFLWLDGAWAEGAENLAVINPATGAEIAKVSLADAGAFSRAIDGAHAAFAKWKGEPAAGRGDILKKTAALMVQRRKELGELLTTEQGKPLAQALGEVDYAASFFQWFGEEARRLAGRLQPHPVKGREYIVRSVPAGVAGLVTPWNFPMAQGAKKVAAALAAGCTVVWKPSELTPLVALAMGPLMKEAGLPDGVLQILPAFGPVGGTALTADARIRVLSLTGSTETGRTLMKAASQHLPKLSFELGGNAPFILLPDADLDAAAADLVKLKVFVSGQVCVTANRVFVPAKIERDFTAKLVALWKDLKIGNGLTQGTDVGPLIHSKACERVKDLVAKAVGAGAEIVAENRAHEADKALAGGSFYPPTIIRGVRDDMELVTGEIFGPVLPILTYGDVAEAVRRANATPYGLAAYVYGSDLALAGGVAESIEAGIVGVNEWRPLRSEIPFGGIKSSGLGSEGGTEGIHEFCETKTISLPSSPRY